MDSCSSIAVRHRRSPVSSSARAVSSKACALGGVLFLSAFVLPQGGPVLGVRVNDPLPPGEIVNLWTLSSDGEQVFYVETQGGFGGGPVFAVASDGSQGALALTAPLAPGRELVRLQASPDGQRVVYTADRDALGVYELYSVPADASQAPVELNPPLVLGGDVFPLFFRITPDSSRVVFLADATVNGLNKLYSAPIDGSQPAVQLADLTVVGLFQITSDGNTVVFASDAMYSVPVDGSTEPLQLSGPAALGQPMTDYQLSPDGQWVVFRTQIYDEKEVATGYVWSTRVDDQWTPGLLFDPVVEGFIQETPSIGVSPDSAWVVYRTAPDVAGSDPREIFSAPIDGSEPAVRLNDPVLPGVGGGASSLPFRFAPDNRVVFGFTPGEGVPDGIYVVPVDRSTSPIRITANTAFPTPIKWEVGQRGRVVFSGRTGGDYELFSVPLDGSELPIRLSSPMVANGDLWFGDSPSAPSFRFGPDGRSVVYAADQDTDEVIEAYLVPIDGSRPARKVNRRPPPGGDVSLPVFTPDGRHVLYQGERVNDVFEVFTSSLSEPPTFGDPTPLPPGRGIR